jgi:Ca-activated chloride channel family protein
MCFGTHTLPGPEGYNQPRGSFTAAHKASDAKIPISTISFGTLLGRIILQGRAVPVPVDDDSLRRIAQITGGQFFTAASQEELQKVYETLGEQIGYEVRRVDTSRPWLIGGALLAILGMGSAFALGRRLP